MKNYPKARSNNIVVQEMEDEVLVYDLYKNKAICLNETAAIVWRLCDGIRSIDEIVEILSKKFRMPVEENVVWMAIDQLKAEKLLSNGEDIESEFTNLSRREIIRKVGATSLVALPIISFITAPTAVMSQSCSNNETACSSDTECCSGNCLMTTSFGVKCCEPGSINGFPPGNNAFCTGSGAVCNSQATQFCCSGSATLGSQGPCSPGFFQCICD